jgi:hypothetical protein
MAIYSIVGGSGYSAPFFGQNLAELGTAAGRPFSHTEFAEKDLRRAKVRESGLNEIQADEDCKPEPMGANPVSECEAEEHQAAGENADSVFDGHKF